MKNEELRRTFLFLLSGQELSFLSRPGQGRRGEERRGDTRDDQQQTGRTWRWVNMSDDIRRKKKKAAKKKVETKPAEPARKESEVIQETPSSKSSPDPGESQEKQSVLSKALFFCSILGETLYIDQ